MKKILQKEFLDNNSRLFRIGIMLCLVLSLFFNSDAKVRLPNIADPKTMPNIFIDNAIANFPAKSIQNNSNVYQLFSHGRPGELLINGEWKNAKQIASFLKPQLSHNTKHINIYGCNFARGAVGEEAVAYLEKALGVSVSASTNITGVAGDWTLEVGQHVATLNLPNYEGNLQTTVYVNSAATGSGNGTSWANGFSTLNSALNAYASTSPLIVKVAAGTYNEPTNAQATLTGATVSITGGYNTATGVSNPQATPSILNYSNTTTVDPYAGSTVGIIKYAGTGGNFTMNGLTVQNLSQSALGGGSPTSTNFRGTVFFLNNTSTTSPMLFKNMVVSNNLKTTDIFQIGNTWPNGSPTSTASVTFDSLYATNNTTTMSVLNFSGTGLLSVQNSNFCSNTSSGNFAGGIYFQGNGGLLVDNSTFNNNVLSSGTGISAGAILIANEYSNTIYGNVILQNSSFAGNLQTANSGSAAGAVWVGFLSGTLQVNSCQFYNNKGARTGAIQVSATPALNTSISNCNFNGNVGGNFGALSFTNGPLTLSGSIFANNKGPSGTIYSNMGNPLTFSGNSFVNNLQTNNSTTIPTDIYVVNSIGTLSNNNLQSASTLYSNEGFSIGTGNVFSNGGASSVPSYLTNTVATPNCTKVCNAGTGVPTVKSTSVNNICPAVTATLTGVVTSTCPNGANLVWSNSATPNSNSIVSNTTAISANGQYYAACYDPTNLCYSPTTAVAVNIVSCCAAGPNAPVLSSSTKSNVCPIASVNLTGVVTSTCPTGSTLEWHTTNVGLSAVNKMTNTTSVLAGVYYPVCYDAALNCYSPTPNPGLTVSITSCGALNPDFNATPVNIQLTGNVNTNDVNASGMTYNQPMVIPSNPNPSSCIPYMNPNGVYSFNCATPGVYNYMVPVCPSATSTVGCQNVPLEITVIGQSAPTANGPVANTDIASTPQNVTVTLITLANDKVVNPATSLNPASVVITKYPASGTPTVNPTTGNISYSPNTNFTGNDTLTYQVCDLTGKCAKAQQIITVLPSTAPNTTVAADDYNTTPVNTPVSGNVKTNDSDPQNNTQYVTPMSNKSVTGGVITMGTDGAYTFTPTTNFVGPVDVPYQTCDNGSPVACTNATLHITITNFTTSGVYNPDFNVTPANVPLTGNTKTNDPSVPANAIYGNPTPVSGNPNNTCIPVMASNGTYTFTCGTIGTYNYMVPVCEATNVCAKVPLQIVVTDPVTPTNNGPIANTDITSTPLNTQVTLPTLANDKVGNPATTLNPSSVTVTKVPTKGSTTVNTTTGDIIYVPYYNNSGTDTLTYQVCDMTGKCAKAQQIITILPNGATNTTVAADDYNSTKQGTPVSGNVKTNDKDPEGNSQNVTAQNNVPVTGGNITIYPDGSYTYTPNATYTGPVDVPYTTCDVLGACATATLHITITPNTTGTYNPDVNATPTNVPVTGILKTNDKNVPTNATYGTPVPVSGNPTNCIPTITNQLTGAYTFTCATPGVFNYLVPVCPVGQSTSCPLVPLVITVIDPVTPTNNGPVANTDFASTPVSTPVTLKTLANDKVGNPATSLNPASISIVKYPIHGTVTYINPTTGDVTYTPTTGYVGTDTLTYQVCDMTGKCAKAQQIITILENGVANTTVAVDDYNSTPMNTPVYGSVKTNDSDPEGNTQTVAPQASTTVAGKGTLQLFQDGSYTFTPVTGFSGPVEFPYTTTDNGNPVATASATLHIVVVPVPTGIYNPDVNVTPANVPVPGILSTNDKNIPTGATYGAPTPVPGNPSGCVPTITNNATGAYTFTCPTPGVYNFTVPVCASGNCMNVPLQITVTDPLPTNNGPIANTDIATTPVSTPVVLKTLANDKVGNPATTLNPATVSIVTPPLHGSVTYINPTTGDVTFTPTVGYIGTDTLKYQICDMTGKCAQAKQIITILPSGATNTTVAVDDYNATPMNTPVSSSVITNDNDPQGNAITVTPQNTSLTAGTLVLSSTGAYTFTPANGFTGPVDFPYTITDNGTPPATATATLHITVTGCAAIAAPSLTQPTAAVCPSITGAVALPSTGCSTGTLKWYSDAALTMASSSLVSPTTTTTYYASCESGTCKSPATNYTLTVMCLVNDYNATPVGTQVTANMKPNDSVPNGSIYGTPTPSTGNPTGATITVYPDGTYIFTPTQPGTYIYTVPVCPPSPSTISPCPTETLTITSGCANMTAPAISQPTAAVCPSINGSVSLPTTGCTTGTLTWYADANLTVTSSTVVSPIVSTSYYAACVSGICKSQSTTYNVTVMCLVDDYNSTPVGTLVTANMKANDNVPVGSTYGTPTPGTSNPTGATIVMYPDGTYTFTPTQPGTYTYTVPVCPPNSTINPCPTEILTITSSCSTNITAPTVTAPASTCPGSSTTLSGSGCASGTILTWYNSSALTTAISNVVAPTTTTTYYAACVSGACKSVSIPVTVVVGQCFVAVPDVATTAPSTLVKISVLTNDKNPDGTTPATLVYVTMPTIVSYPTKGVATVNPADGSINYTPNAGVTGTTDVFTYSICDKANPTVCTSTTATITIGASLDAKLNLKVFLQGAFLTPSTGSETLMRDDLRSWNVIPLTEPYTGLASSTSRFTRVADAGGQTTTAAVLAATGNDAIVDWVFVELHDAANPATVIKTKAALVQRDGDVVEATDGTTPITFTGAVGTSYYVAVKHRNHIGAMTATAIGMTNTGTIVDFTTMAAANTYDKGLVLPDGSLGTFNSSELVKLNNGKMALWAGNVRNLDNKIKYTGTANEPNVILTQVITYGPNSGVLYNYNAYTPTYMTGDVNLDAKVKYTGTTNDSNLILNNVINLYPNNLTSKLFNFDFLMEQIP